MVKYTPPEIESLLADVFGFPKTMTVAQVATYDAKGPVCRTMCLYDLTEDKEPLFLTYRHSLKWKQLENAPTIAICLLDALQEVQILCRGGVRLIEGESNPLLDKYWPMVDQGVRDVAYPSRDLFCGIAIQPTFWEVLSIEDHYPDSLHVTHELLPDGWQMESNLVGEMKQSD